MVVETGLGAVVARGRCLLFTEAGVVAAGERHRTHPHIISYQGGDANEHIAVNERGRGRCVHHAAHGQL